VEPGAADVVRNPALRAARDRRPTSVHDRQQQIDDDEIHPLGPQMVKLPAKDEA
jgi:hypothetical protein